MEFKVEKLDSKGNLTESDFGEVTFNDFERAMDLRRYLQGDHVVTFFTNPDYQILRKNGSSHYVLLRGNTGTDTEHFVAYDYISNGDGYGRPVYCSSKTYKSRKGALKKIRTWMDWR